MTQIVIGDAPLSIEDVMIAVSAIGGVAPGAPLLSSVSGNACPDRCISSPQLAGPAGRASAVRPPTRWSLPQPLGRRRSPGAAVPSYSAADSEGP